MKPLWDENALSSGRNSMGVNLVAPPRPSDVGGGDGYLYSINGEGGRDYWGDLSFL